MGKDGSERSQGNRIIVRDAADGVVPIGNARFPAEGDFWRGCPHSPGKTHFYATSARGDRRRGGSRIGTADQERTHAAIRGKTHSRHDSCRKEDGGKWFPLFSLAAFVEINSSSVRGLPGAGGSAISRPGAAEAHFNCQALAAALFRTAAPCLCLCSSSIELDEAVFVRFEPVTFFAFAEHTSRFPATRAVPEPAFLDEIVLVHPALDRTPVSGVLGNTVNAEHLSKIGSCPPNT
jgi:hypothetical protein